MMDPNTKAVTIYCASSDNIDPAYVDAAHTLGRLLADAGVAVVNGGGRMGLMGAVTDSVLDAGGHAVGVIPQFMVEKGLCHPRLTHTVVTPDMSTRKKQLAALGQGAIALPGGVGTFEELFETLTNSKLGFYPHPVVILNTAGYFDPLIAMLLRSEEQGFSYGPRGWQVATSPEEALHLIFPDC